MSSTRLFICVPFLKPFVLLQANVVLSLSLVCDKGKRISGHHLFFRFAVATCQLLNLNALVLHLASEMRDDSTTCPHLNDGNSIIM